MSILYSKGPGLLRRIDPATSTTITAIGQLLKVASNEGLPMATSTDNLTYLGVCNRARISGDVINQITYYPPGDNTEFVADLDTATTASAGAGYAMVESDPTKLTQTDTDAIFVGTESIASESKVLVKMKLPETELGDAS